MSNHKVVIPPIESINLNKKWLSIEEAAAILKMTIRSAHGAMKRHSVASWRGDKKHYWSTQQVVALAERLSPTVKVHAPKFPAARVSSPVDGDCEVCKREKAHFTGERMGVRIPLCFRCFNDASYTAVRHGQSVRVVTS